MITKIVKKHIYYNQVKDETFQDFVAGHYMGTISAKFILLCSDNTILNRIMQEYNKQNFYLNKLIFRQVRSLVYMSCDI